MKTLSSICLPVYPADTKIENISDKRTTLMEYWMPKFGFKFQLYKLYGEKPQAGQCRVCRFFATLRMTIHCFLWAPLRMTIHCFLRTAHGMTMKMPGTAMKMPGILKENRTLWNGLSNAMRQSAVTSDCATGERFNLITKSVIPQLDSYNFTLSHQATGLDTQSCSTIYRNFISHTTFEFLIIFQMRRYWKNSNK